MARLDDLLTLRLRTLAAFPECALDERSIAHESDRVKQTLERAEAVELLHRGGQTRAAIVIGRPTEAMLGLRDTPGDVYCAPDDADAQTWAGDTLVARKDRLDRSFVTILPPTQRRVLEAIEGRGYRIQALRLHGDPGIAFERLGGSNALREREKISMDAHGICFAPLCSRQHVEQLVEQRRAFFTSNPQVSPISTARTIDETQQAQIDQFVRQSLLDGMHESQGTQFVVTHSNEAVGGFGLILSDASPVWGKCAGVEVFLQPSVQGLGLGPLLYLMLLRRMLELEIRTFRGTTANPAVIHLSHKMGRRLRGWKIVRGHREDRPSYLDYSPTGG